MQAPWICNARRYFSRIVLSQFGLRSHIFIAFIINVVILFINNISAASKITYLIHVNNPWWPDSKGNSQINVNSTVEFTHLVLVFPSRCQSLFSFTFCGYIKNREFGQSFNLYVALSSQDILPKSAWLRDISLKLLSMSPHNYYKCIAFWPHIYSDRLIGFAGEIRWQTLVFWE